MNNKNIDAEAWEKTHIEDLWIFDKLILSKKLGYKCGPKGTEVPKPEKYIVKPITNTLGMSIGSKFIQLDKTTDHIPDGHFWCERFTGKHLSIDYYKGKQVLCVEGIRSDINNTQKWDIWRKTEDEIPFPDICKELKGKYDWINVELIDNRIIEIHLRKNLDFEGHTSRYVIPVYEGPITFNVSYEEFVYDEDHNRIGFIIQK